MAYIKFDPTDEFYKSVVGAVAENEPFGIRLQLNKVVNPSSVTLVVYSDGDFCRNYPMNHDASGDGYDNYVANVKLTKGSYKYYFVLDGVSYEHFIGMGEDRCPSVFYERASIPPICLQKKVSYARVA